MPRTLQTMTTMPLRAAMALACVPCVGGLAPAVGAAAHDRLAGSGFAPAMGTYSASLEQCTPSAIPADRSVTFSGEMVATPGTQRMGMKIELLERVRGEQDFHVVAAPGIGLWRGSEAGVRIYRYVKQITNLSAPAAYRAVVHFRWLGDKGRVVKRAELRTAKCVQPLLTPPASGEQASGAASSSGEQTAGGAPAGGKQAA